MNVEYFELQLTAPTTAHRAVTVHLSLTLKAFSLSEFVALHVQITGLAVYGDRRLGPGGIKQ